jgi:SAM-dependent methyltransferase
VLYRLLTSLAGQIRAWLPGGATATSGPKWSPIGWSASVDHRESILATAGATLRLNLGCGDKILPGYVNVDVAETRVGRCPDVVCDLRDLAVFADGCADEVMAIHVVEHFWRWEVLGVLREWLRVLKPGGTMVLECPNLVSACAELLRDPGALARPGAEGQRTMWVLYGDPSWRDPLMCHRWAYTPQSLRELMEEAGLRNVRQEPAQFKLREPRDMRLVGEKPVRT